MIVKEMDIRLKQYLIEKSMLERHGHVSSITYEQWLEIKGFTKKKEVRNEENYVQR